MKLKFTILIVLLFIKVVHGQNKLTTEPITIEIGFQHKIKSSILNEDRKLLIHLPEGYQLSKKQYPVIYILDGNNHFEHATIATKILQENERMPESIIVAIPNNLGTRGRDLAREREKFMQFIKEEVISFVKKNYRTTKLKSLFGHSMAGAFVLNFLASEPSLFENYIAASPVIQIKKSELLIKFPELFEKEKSLNKSLYFTLTDAVEEGERATVALNKFVELLKNKAPKTFNWKYNFIEDQVHMTTPYLTMFEGLNFIYNDYQSPAYSTFKEYENSGGMKALKKHYRERAIKYNTSKQIPENTMRSLAYVILDEGKTELAIQMFKENIKNNPNIAVAYNGLGDAYESINENKKALDAYEKAVNLAKTQSSSNTGYFTRQLNRVKKKLEN